jgi:DNA end-binding protein Ku
MRDTPHLAAVEAIDDALVLSTMRFQEELVDASDYKFPRPQVRAPEMKMAGQLIEGLTGDWNPRKYTNEYRANLMKIIEAKRKNRTPKLQRQEMEADSNVVDLMERLRASLGQPGPRSDARRLDARASKTTAQDARLGRAAAPPDPSVRLSADRQMRRDLMVRDAWSPRDQHARQGGT